MNKSNVDGVAIVVMWINLLFISYVVYDLNDSMREGVFFHLPLQAPKSILNVKDVVFL